MVKVIRVKGKKNILKYKKLEITIHLGKNPTKGGIPPIERRFNKIINKDDFFKFMENICLNKKIL